MTLSKEIKKPTKSKGAEFDPDAWDRFERAVDVALHTPAKHKAAPKKKPAKKSDPKKDRNLK